RSPSRGSPGAYVAVMVGGTVARLVGFPWPLLAPLALVQALVKCALVVAVLASLLDRLDVAARRRSALRVARVCAAVGLFWLAGLSFAAGQVVMPRPTSEAAVAAPADAFVASSPLAMFEPVAPAGPRSSAR